MKNILNAFAFAVLFGTLLLPGQAWAQLQLNLTGNHLSSAESGARFSDGLWGGGATLRYFVSPKFAVGLNGRYFTHNQSGNIGGGTSFKSRANLVSATGQVEYFFTTSVLRPYVGVEAGYYRTTSKDELIGAGIASGLYSYSIDNFGVAPKVGLQYAITPAFGLNVDAGYQLIFSHNDTGKALLLGAGVFYTFGRR